MIMENTLQDKSGQILVSIITIVLNGQEVIRQTIDSVLSQSYEAVEYIIIDGGSTDGTVDIINEYESSLHYWQSGDDNGISDAFNKGIRRARGQVIGLLNAGDWYEPDCVENVVNVFREDNNTGVVCGSLQLWRGEDPEYLCSSVPELLDREMTVTHPTCFIRADLYKKVGLYSTKYSLAMDYEILLRIKMHGGNIVALARTLANMRHDGISEENWQDALRESHRARTELLGKSFFTTSWYLNFLILKRWLRTQLERLGFDNAVRFYRKRIALVKKTK